MYRYSNGQISLADFKQPVGMNLKESNRWVKKAQTIPWSEIEKRYAALFTNRKGNVAKPLRLALGACIIQAEYGYSDEETALQIQENPYLQYFCGYPGYDDEKLPFDPSLMVYFRKRLTPEVLGEINEMIVRTHSASWSATIKSILWNSEVMPLKYSSIDAPKAHCTWASFRRCAIICSNSIFFCSSFMMHLTD